MMIAAYLSAIGAESLSPPAWALCDPRLDEWDHFVTAAVVERLVDRVALITTDEIAARLGRHGQDVAIMAASITRLMRLGVLVPLLRGGFVVCAGPVTAWRRQTFEEWCAESLADLPAAHERMRLEVERDQ
jgi:hypothetical protein